MKELKIILGNKKSVVSAVLSISIIMSSTLPIFGETEVPIKTYRGINNAEEIIKNISFNDIAAMPNTYWAKEAIYEMGALEAIKGYGDRNFRPDSVLTKEEAIAVIYRMIGKEANAQKAAEKLDQVRSRIQKKDQAVEMWSDGYLQLAADEGLITQADLQVALQRFQPKAGTKMRFVRADPAERQEVANWIAKAIKLEPIYGQQNVFNNFNDWLKSSPEKIPYIEAVLQNKIMNGNSNGYFDPTGPVKRNQMAQILKNAESIVLPVKKLEKKTGYVETIFQDKDEKLGGGIVRKVIAVRGDDGKLYNIISEVSQNKLDSKKQEFSAGDNIVNDKEMVVYKDGKLGTTEIIKPRDQLEYIVNDAGEVKFIKATAGLDASKEVKARIIGFDEANNTISTMDDSGNIVTYNLKNNAEIFNDGVPIIVSQIPRDSQAKLYIRNNLVYRVDASTSKLGGLEDGISGIVEDNNPKLKYISLYNQEGLKDASSLRIFSIIPENVEVQKNHKNASINDIEPGDTVHIAIGEDGNVKQLSAVDNYEPAYGKVIVKQAKSLAVEYDNGTQQVLDVADDVAVIWDKKVVSYDKIEDGDYIRVLLQKTPAVTKIKQITKQNYAQDISNVYKAELSGIDVANTKITLKHPEKLYKGKWERDSQIGFLALRASDNLKMFNGNKQLDIDEVNKAYHGKEVYVAVRRSYGNEEVAEFIAFVNPASKEILYDDTISSVTSGSNQITLNKMFNPVRFNEGTIVVKDGRLVTGRSLLIDDAVYIVANHDINSQAIEAGVITTIKKTNLNLVQVFRGKVGQINTNKDFSLETFSILNGLTWEYNAFVKTFSINYDTRIVGENGVISVRDFNPYAEETYIGKPIYVIANETEALLISTAPYGVFNVRGEVLSTEADTTDSAQQPAETSTTTSSSKLKLVNASIYDKDKGDWVYKGLIELGVLTNTVVVKNGDVVSIDKIERGDLVRVLKKDTTATGDAYLILVEK